MKKKVLCVIGTRPEVIKMAPVIALLKANKQSLLRVLSTAQHREILDQMLKIFEIVPDIDLNLMETAQTLPQLTARLPLPLDQVLQNEKPDLVLAQGDTTTAFMVSLASFYQKIPFGHVEAGLRSSSFFNPFPEEMNRVLISRLSTLNFAPTPLARQNLLNEGYSGEQIFVTGNTVIDALQAILRKQVPIDSRIQKGKRLILVTAHRRENFGEKLEDICSALRTLADANEDVQIFYPVHPNPEVRSRAEKRLSHHSRIILSEPLSYEQFVKLMQQAYFIISDSGGVQEEAPALGKPVLVIRDTTERPEGIEAGTSKLVGTKCKNIIREAQLLLNETDAYRKMVARESPFGDGKAAERIVKVINHFLGS